MSRPLGDHTPQDEQSRMERKARMKRNRRALRQRRTYPEWEQDRDYRALRDLDSPIFASREIGNEHDFHAEDDL